MKQKQVNSVYRQSISIEWSRARRREKKNEIIHAFMYASHGNTNTFRI